jgi:hypothetical protein
LLLIQYLNKGNRLHRNSPEGAPRRQPFPSPDMTPALCRSYGLPCRPAERITPCPLTGSQSALCSLFFSLPAFTARLICLAAGRLPTSLSLLFSSVKELDRQPSAAG